MRNASRRPAVLVLLAMVASLLGVITPTAAQAASVYDDAVQLTDSVVVAASSSSTPIDVTRNWDSYIASASGSCTSGVKTSLLNALDHGSVAVNQELNNSSSTDYRRVQVSWSESATTSMIWLGSGSSASVVFPSIYPGPPTTGGAILFMNSSGNAQVICDVAAFGQAWSNAAGTAKGLFATNSPNYPTGYAGTLIPAATPPAKYVAMGDSFSSGEGNAPFEAGTDTGSNKCHRSPLAYPRLLQNDASLNLGSTAFVACSGATTSNVLNGGSADGAWGENPQIDALSADTEVVTITIGGNDVGFKAFATACTIGSCDFATTAYTDIHGKIVNDLPGALADVYEAIDNATSSTANIYVVGYPQIAPAEMPTGANSACYPLNGGADNPDPELNDGATAYAVVSELNSVIHNAVNNMNPAKFHFVDPNLSGSPFIGHDWCQQDRYFVQIGVPIPPSNTEYSFHPNADGQAAYKTVVEGAMS